MFLPALKSCTFQPIEEINQTDHYYQSYPVRKERGRWRGRERERGRGRERVKDRNIIRSGGRGRGEGEVVKREPLALI